MWLLKVYTKKKRGSLSSVYGVVAGAEKGENGEFLHCPETLAGIVKELNEHSTEKYQQYIVVSTKKEYEEVL